MADKDEISERGDETANAEPGSQNPDPVDAAVARAVQQIDDEARRAAVDTRLEIQEKTRRWITASGTLLGLVVGLLTLFGYKQAYDFQSKLQALEDEAQQQLATVKKQISTQADDLSGRITALGKKLSRANADFQAQLAKLKETERRLDDSRSLLQEAKRLNSEFSGAQAQVAQQLKQIAKLQNSFFDVFIICDAPPSRRAEVVEPLRQSLEASGFVLKPENVYTSTVDRTEVLYYDKDRPDQVDLLLRLLKDTPLGKKLNERGHEIKARFISERNPRELLIKLRAL